MIHLIALLIIRSQEQAISRKKLNILGPQQNVSQFADDIMNRLVVCWSANNKTKRRNKQQNKTNQTNKQKELFWL